MHHPPVSRANRPQPGESDTRWNAVEDAIHGWCRRTPGLRVVDQIVWTRRLRVSVMLECLNFVCQTITSNRPDLIHPSDIGSDSSNYVRVVERLTSGGEIYGLRSTDRPVPKDNPPNVPTPILSPPTIAA